MVDSGIDEDAFEPAFEGGQDVRMAGLLELMNVLEKFDEAFIHYLLYLFKVVLVTIAYFHSVVLEHRIKLFLAGPVIRPAALYQSEYLRVSCDQNRCAIFKW